MKQKMLCFGNDFAINDEHGKLAYFIDGKAFTFGEQLSFQDASRKELAFISQKMMAFTKTFSISRNREVVAVVKKKPLSMRDRFEIDLPNTGSRLEIQGDFFQHEYSIRRDGKPVAQISKRMFSMTDSYGIDIFPEQDPVLLLAAAVVVDLVCHNETKK